MRSAQKCPCDNPEPTVLDFLTDQYLTNVEAIVMSCQDGRVVLDRTVFFPATGIAPADHGEIITADSRIVPVRRVLWDDLGRGILIHLIDPSGSRLWQGERVWIRVDWASRYSQMRVHTALHLLSVALPYPLITGEIDGNRGSATFETDQIGIKARELENIIQELVAADFPVESIWVPPPLRDSRIFPHSFVWPGSGELVRGIRIGAIDAQLCDGLHVRTTSEVGRCRVTDVRQIARYRHRCEIMVDVTS